MIKVKVYGKLRKFVGQSFFDLEITSPKEAFSFLVNNFQGIKEHIKEQEYCIMAGDVRITEDLLDMQTQSEIKIIPVVHGEFLNFILGAAAIFGGKAVAGATVGILGAKILGTTVGVLAGAALTSIGINMVVGGVTDLLTPDVQQPQQSGMDQTDPQALTSFNFTGLTNVSKQGVPIPIVYGEVMVGSVIVSAGVDTFQINS